MTAVKPEKLPRLDRALIREEEQRKVDAEMDPLIQQGPEARLRAASVIVDAAQAEFDRLRPLRDAAGLSLSLYEHRRAVNTAMALSRTAFHEMRCAALRLTAEERAGQWLAEASAEQVEARAKAAKVKRVKTAAEDLPGLAEQAVRAEERARTARAWRDHAALELLDPPHNWARPEIARIIGKNPSRVSHIKGAAARTGS